MNWLRSCMMCRYGPDQLYIALVITSAVFLILASLTGWLGLLFFSLLLFIYGYFRVLSRNIYKRSLENQKFLRLWSPIQSKVKQSFNRIKTLRTHKYFRCTSCKQRLRVPRKKGKIRIICPRCKTQMIKKS